MPDPASGPIAFCPTGGGTAASNIDYVQYLTDNTIPTTAPMPGVDTVVLLDGTKYEWNGASWALVSTGVPTCPEIAALFTVTADCTTVPNAVKFLGSDCNAYDATSIAHSAQRQALTVTTSAADAAIDITVADVWRITGGTAYTLGTPAACTPTDVWVKNSSAVPVVLTPASGTIDTLASFTIPAANLTLPTAGMPTYHFVWDGTAWWII